MEDRRDCNESMRQMNELRRLLDSIDRPGDYCAYGKMLASLPVLGVPGMDALSFPVPESQVRTLIEYSSRSPFGKGPETLIDQKVRDSWEIHPSEFSIEGRGWNEAFSEILKDAAEGIGCPRERLDAELYKLLIYETGGFFLPHRDTEKTDGMVATLVVALPVRGSGGEIVVRHKGHETVIDMRGGEPSEIAWAAFYADCEHEIRPVLEGHRIVLVYSLVLSNGTGITAAPDFNEKVPEIARVLSLWKKDAGRNEKMIWLLDHDYSEAGLSFDTLKNVDASVAGVVAEAAGTALCSLYAATLTIEETVDAVPDGGYGDESYSAGDLLDYTCVLEHLTAPGGAGEGFKKIEFRKEEVLQNEELENMCFYEEEVEEWTGNAGATIERTYRSAALVLWPEENTFDIVASNSIHEAAGYVETLVERDDPRAGGFASRLRHIWEEEVPWGAEKAINAALRIFSRLEDISSLKLLLGKSVTNYKDVDNKDIIPALRLLGAGFAGGFLPGMVSENFVDNAEDILRLAASLCEDPGNDPKWRDTLARGMCGSILLGLPDCLAYEKPQLYSWRRKKESLSPEAVRNLLAAFLALGLTEEAAHVVKLLINNPERVDPGRAVPGALERLAGFEWTESLNALWVRSAEFLVGRSAAAPEFPKDWKIASVEGCGCEDCATLREFCEDPDHQEHRFKINAERRSHLSRVISDCDLEIYYHTEKKGSPYTLVCMKNRSGHEKDLGRYAEDLIEMKRLVAIAPESQRENVKRLNDALACCD